MIDLFVSHPVQINQTFSSKNPIQNVCTSHCFLARPSLSQLVGNSPESDQSIELNPSSPQSQFNIFPVGLNLYKKNAIASSLVRGTEENGQAVDFKNWLISFDDVIKLLEIKVRILDDGQLELTSPGFVFRISPQQLTQDPELGLTISVAKIESLLGVPVTFDLAGYAIAFAPAWLGSDGVLLEKDSTISVVLEGLPLIEATDLSLSAIGINYQSLGSSNSPDGLINDVVNQSQFISVGSILGGSWFINVNQNDLGDWTTWSLKEAQYLRQTPQADYAIGSQSSFWDLQDGSDYWGMTTIQRFGFTPPVPQNVNSDQSNGFLPSQRLQSNQLNRTVSGEAAPGTLVQLRVTNSKQAIAEVLVDQSGIYRFDTKNVVNNPQGVGSSGQLVNYQVFLYPEGKRTQTPEIRDVRFLLLPLQLPTGASALVTSAGIGRDFLDQGFFGDFTHFKGGVGYFYGVSEDVTLGTGVIQDGGVLPSATIIYQPNGIPLGFNVTSLFGINNDQGWAYSAGLSYYPNPDITLSINSTNFNQDYLVQSFQFTWRTTPSFTWRFGGNDRDRALLVGFNFSQKFDNLYVSTGINYDTQNNLLWQGIVGLDKWKLNTFGGGVNYNNYNNNNNSNNNNRFYTNSELTYNFNTWYGTGHAIFLNYNTDYNGSDPNNFLSAGWRYQSEAVTYDYRPQWIFDLGYGVGSDGSGLVASVGTNIIPGATIRGTYRQVGLGSNRDNFLIQVFPSFSLQPDLALGDRRFQNLRTRGGLWLKPFLDKNSNGIMDDDDEIYSETPKQLFKINNRSLKNFSGFNTTPQAIIVQIPPGTYRLDLDPSGYPLDYKPINTAYAVEVVAGSYTTVAIPFVPSYTVGGTVVDNQGKAIVGARVEAISIIGENKVISVTDGTGIFYLENLQRGVYKLFVNGQETEPNSVEITKDTPSLSEINLQVLQ